MSSSEDNEHVVPLVIYDKSGEREIIGEATVSQDGSVVLNVEHDRGKEILADIDPKVSLIPFFNEESDPPIDLHGGEPTQEYIDFFNKVESIGEIIRINEATKEHSVNKDPIEPVFGIEKALGAVLTQVNNRGHALSFDDVYVVWFCKTLKNWKAMVSTTLQDDMYYEVTYNGEKKEMYLDCYEKIQNLVIPDDTGTPQPGDSIHKDTPPGSSATPSLSDW